MPHNLKQPLVSSQWQKTSNLLKTSPPPVCQRARRDTRCTGHYTTTHTPGQRWVVRRNSAALVKDTESGTGRSTHRTSNSKKRTRGSDNPACHADAVAPCQAMLCCAVQQGSARPPVLPSVSIYTSVSTTSTLHTVPHSAQREIDHEQIVSWSNPASPHRRMCLMQRQDIERRQATQTRSVVV